LTRNRSGEKAKKILGFRMNCFGQKESLLECKAPASSRKTKHNRPGDKGLHSPLSTREKNREKSAWVTNIRRRPGKVGNEVNATFNSLE